MRLDGGASLQTLSLLSTSRLSGPFQGWGLKREHAPAGNTVVQGFSALTWEVAQTGICALGATWGRGRQKKGVLSFSASWAVLKTSVAWGIQTGCG